MFSSSIGSGITISLIPVIAAVLITPGCIIHFIASRFLIGKPDFSSAFGLIAISIIYYSLLWLIWSILEIVLNLKCVYEYINPITCFAVVVVGPIISGVLSGICIEKNTFYKLLKKWARDLLLHQRRPLGIHILTIQKINILLFI